MKKLTAIILSVLMVLSVGGLVVYVFHQKTLSGGEAPVIAFASDVLEVPTTATEEDLLQEVLLSYHQQQDLFWRERSLRIWL